MPEFPSIHDLPLFALLSPEEAQQALKSMRYREVAADEILMHEGETGDQFYLIVKGEFEIFGLVPAALRWESFPG